MENLKLRDEVICLRPGSLEVNLLYIHHLHSYKGKRRMHLLNAKELKNSLPLGR